MHIYQVHHLMWAQMVAPQNNYNSNINIINTEYPKNITIMKMFERMQELPKCNRDIM